MKGAKMPRMHTADYRVNTKPRFKIDFDDYLTRPFALFYRTRRTWLDCILKRTWWERLDNFETLADAQSYYDKVKDLPIYRD